MHIKETYHGSIVVNRDNNYVRIEVKKMLINPSNLHFIEKYRITKTPSVATQILRETKTRLGSRKEEEDEEVGTVEIGIRKLWAYSEGPNKSNIG